MAKSLGALALYFAILAVPLGYIYKTYSPAVQRIVTLFGIYRHTNAIKVESPEDLVLIEGTIHCEDLHYYAPTHELYSACEDSHATRFSWFPPLAEFNASVINQARGGLFVINPDTKKAKKLKLENFKAPFVTHGIDVIPDPKAGAVKAVYIFAVNHVPNPDFWDENFVPKAQTSRSSAPKARSQIEIFRHEIGSPTARHVRSVRDPLITTPNDIVALDPTQFLVTNDFHYREGLLRQVEQLYPGAAWTNTIHVELSDLLTGQADAAVKAKVVVDSIRGNNGLGHGRTDSELLITSAVGGSLHITEPSTTGTNHAYHIVEEIPLDSTIDNPSYFRDPYASSSFDGSGFVLAGLGRAIDLAKTHADPHAKESVVVWYVKEVDGRWEKRLIFEDDGSTVRSSSVAVLIAIDPAKEGGKRRAWLYVTGFLSSHIVAVKVDL